MSPFQEKRRRAGIATMGLTATAEHAANRAPGDGAVAGERPPGDLLPDARDAAARPEDACDGERNLRAPKRRDDAGRLDENERRHRVGPLGGQPERDDAAEGMADEGGGRRTLALGDGGDEVRERPQVADRPERPRATVSRQVGGDDAKPPREKRRDERPVDRAAAEAVDEHDGSAFAADEVAGANPVDRRRALLEPAHERCLRRHGTVFCGHGSSRSA